MIGPVAGLAPAERAAVAAAAERESVLDAGEARKAGIVHTPPELARFMARAADQLLRRQLGLRGGLFDPALAVIDPACGPGAFLGALAALPLSGLSTGGSQVHAWDRDAHAVELARRHLAAPLGQRGLHCHFETRDTLLQALPEQAAALRPSVCVLGNPPWIGRAQPRPSPFLDQLLEDFRRDEHGLRLRERKLGVLADAYVRFLCWACEVARLAVGGGLVAFVTNGSWLDGPVHRGMRGVLSRVFDGLFIVDLGGNALLARGAEQDDNVFGVRPSAAVLFALRRAGGGEPRSAGTIAYTRLLGSRRAKLQHLAVHDLDGLSWERLERDAPQRRFVPTARGTSDYASWPSLEEAMPFHREGIQTNRDSVATDTDKARLIARLTAFARGERTADLAQAFQPLPHYDPDRARAAVAAALARDPDGSRGLLVRPLAYRPFDTRWFAPIAPLCHRPRPELLEALDRSNFALVTVRKDRGAQPYDHFFAARHPIDNCLLSTRSSCRARAFPTHDPGGAENLAGAVAAAFAARLGHGINSTQFAYYALAVLASPGYRRDHAETLRIDYPRIPPPRDTASFSARVEAGRTLSELLITPVGPSASPSSAASLPACDLRFGHHRLYALGSSASPDPAALYERAQRIRALLERLE